MHLSRIVPLVKPKIQHLSLQESPKIVAESSSPFLKFFGSGLHAPWRPHRCHQGAFPTSVWTAAPAMVPRLGQVHASSSFSFLLESHVDPSTENYRIAGGCFKHPLISISGPCHEQGILRIGRLWSRSLLPTAFQFGALPEKGRHCSLERGSGRCSWRLPAIRPR